MVTTTFSRETLQPMVFTTSILAVTLTLSMEKLSMAAQWLELGLFKSFMTVFQTKSLPLKLSFLKVNALPIAVTQKLNRQYR